MTEAEWNDCRDPDAMLCFLATRVAPSQRLSRLFACACLRRITTRHSELIEQVLAVAERYADGAAGIDELQSAKTAADKQAQAMSAWNSIAYYSAGAAVAHPDASVAAQWTTQSVARFFAADTYRTSRAALADPSGTPPATGGAWEASAAFARESATHAPLLRCIIGPRPFPIVGVRPSWQAAPLLRLAQAIYTDRAFDLLPILADALEEAGCHDAVLAHCRGGGEHVRGCWVVDLVIGIK